MSIINLERDMVWTNSNAAVVPLSSAFSATSPSVAANATVEQRVNSFETGFFATGATNNAWAAGCLILPPVDGDVTPYRFIGSISSTPVQGYFAYGYWAASAVNLRRVICFGKSCDVVVAVPALDSADPNYGRPLCFFGGVIDTANGFAGVQGSVQRMYSKPPQFASAVS